MAAASLSPLRGLRPATTLALVLVLASWAGTAAGDVERDLVRARAELMLERERSAQLADDLVKTEARLRAVESDLLALRHECALAAAKEEAARASAPPTMRNVHNARLRDEVDRLFWVERERQRRIQLDQADAFENGPKEITIACPNVRESPAPTVRARAEERSSPSVVQRSPSPASSRFARSRRRCRSRTSRTKNAT